MKMKLILFFIFIYSSLSFALTEKQVIDSVLLHFPLIEEANLKFQASSGELTASEGAFDHKLIFKSRSRIENQYDNQYFETTIERQTALKGINLLAGHRQGAGNFPLYDGKYKTSSGGEIFAGLSVPVLRNFQTDEFRTNLKIKQIENKQASEQLKLKKIIYVHKALSLYYKWVLETQKLKINKENYELAKNRQEMILKRVRAGDLEKIKLTDNMRAMERREGDLIKNEVDINKIRTELSLYVRDQKGNPMLLPSEAMPELILKTPEGPLPVSSTINNPRLEILRLEKEKLNAELAFFDQSKLPGLNLELIGAKELSPNAAYDPESLQFGVKFDLPLENRKAEGKSVAFVYKVKALERETDYVQQQLQQQFDFFVNASSQSKDRWEVTSREFENSKKMAVAEKSRWAQGASDLFMVNLRESDVADVDIRRWSALYEYHQYLLDAKLFSASIL